MENMILTSDDFSDNESLDITNEYNGMDGNGENVSPKLQWRNIPDQAKSLALTIYDPDAPTGSGFWHWVAYDIPIDTSGIDRNIGSVPSAVLSSGGLHARNDFGEFGYGGPCPPKEDTPHCYIFTLYALPLTSLGVNPEEITNAIVRFIINTQSIESTSITAYYGR